MTASGWLLQNYMNTSSRAEHVQALGKKLYSAYLQWATADHLRREANLDDIRDDVDAIVAGCRLVRTRMLNGNQLPHSPRDWSALVAGFGYCDQFNGAACEILAGRFAKSEAFALWDQSLQLSPHTIGRVWSDQYNDWLYFDAFVDPGLVFRRGSNGRPVYLRHVPHITALPNRGVLSEAVYELGGHPLNSYSATFAGYVLRKLRSDNRTASLAAVQPPPKPSDGMRELYAAEAPVFAAAAAAKSSPGSLPAAIAAAEPRAALPPDPPVNDAAFEAVSREYLAARTMHLFGAPDLAFAQYRRVGTDPRASLDWRAKELAIASTIFADANDRKALR
jgi:hypothetical protein